MAKNYANTAKEVLRLVGGDGNVSHFEHCSTRLRFTVVDPSKVKKDALKAIPGVRVLTPHSCRHTYVTQMQALGVDLQTIQSIAGHADLDMTEHYLHVQQSVKEAAVSKFDAAFFPQSALLAAN